MRYGTAMQEFLHGWLGRTGRKAVAAGEVVASPPFGAPYSAVLHAVAIDAFYQTSADFVARTVRRALDLAAEQGAHRVSLVALATGYGRMDISSFGQAVWPLVREEWPPIA